MAKFQPNPELERELITKAQRGDMLAREQLHREYKGMIDSIVYPMAVSSNQPPIAARLEAEKLLDKYIDTVDPNAKNKPSTYIYGNIQKKLSRYLNDRSQTVRTTEFYGVDIGKYTASIGELSQQHGRKPTDEEVLNHMQANFPDKKFSLDHIKRLKDSVRTTVLASGVIGNSDEGSIMTVGDLQFAGGDEDEMIEDLLMDVRLKEMEAEADRLPEPERTIVLHHFGLKGYPELSIRELCVKLGLNKYRVQLHLNNAMDKLKAKADSYNPSGTSSTVHTFLI